MPNSIIIIWVGYNRQPCSGWDMPWGWGTARCRAFDSCQGSGTVWGNGSLCPAGFGGPKGVWQTPTLSRGDHRKG